MLQGNRWVILGIGRDTTAQIPATQRFNIAISGDDAGFVRSLALIPEWTQWNGAQPQLVQPLVQPKLFDVACTPRFDAARFTWQGDRGRTTSRQSPRTMRVTSVGARV